ncbi:hypothetical protein FHR61_003187 [Xanthomonas arboricola]|uniref:Xanthomonadin biosynthesis protein n=1 Tax=Xanthomonas cannabis TaxID=1885674 RepID=A0ABR6JPL1_9XANT|nr:hypothetical protein [Xanthomonas cannabis]MBB5523312.1 hypothetical protein [Xanthomonas cannabis]
MNQAAALTVRQVWPAPGVGMDHVPAPAPGVALCRAHHPHRLTAARSVLPAAAGSEGMQRPNFESQLL